MSQSLIRQNDHRSLKAEFGVGGASVGDALLLPLAATARTFTLVAADVAANEDGTVLVGPLIVELPKDGAMALAFLEGCHWDIADAEVHNEANISADSFLIGQCVTPGGATASATTCLVRLTGDPAGVNSATG